MDNMTNRRLLMLLLAAGLSFGLAACGEDEDGPFTPTEPMGTACSADADCDGNFACNIAEGAEEGICFEACTSATQCAEGFDCAAVEGEETDAEPMMACVEIVASSDPASPYTFVGVLSTTDSPEGTTPGPNVDAIEIIRDGASVFAQSVEANLFVQGSGNAEPGANDPESALGTADIRSAFEGAQECDEAVSANTYSLGATGGYLVVGFGAFEIQDGDTIRVWETSNPPCTNFTARNPGDTYELFVGRADALGSRFDDGWFSQGSISVAGPREFTATLPAAE
ncbi:MAG: hypothetical protein EA398_03715 [Deltaproteobacteria bacterium]|nr:MAG: hypothetical protein EA398_03715 [Deltaproteobacteria bacterium]